MQMADGASSASQAGVFPQSPALQLLRPLLEAQALATQTDRNQVPPEAVSAWHGQCAW